MPKKKPNWRKTQSDLHIHTKMGRERTIIEIGNAYWALYPSRARWLSNQIKELNKVLANGDGTFRDRKGRVTHFQIRVPTELMMFLRRWIPDFAYDSADIDLLKKCWPDFAPRKDRRKKTRLYVSSRYPIGAPADAPDRRADSAADDDSPRQRDDDNEGLREGTEEVSGKSARLVHPRRRRNRDRRYRVERQDDRSREGVRRARS